MELSDTHVACGSPYAPHSLPTHTRAAARAFICFLALRRVWLRVGVAWWLVQKKKDKKESAWERLTSARAREFNTKDAKGKVRASRPGVGRGRRP